MPKLGKHVGKAQALSQSFKVLATIIGYRMDQHPSARSCTSRGAPSCEAVPSEPSMNLYIHSTTGTRFELSLPLEETVEGLKRRLSQRLKVPKERLALLHKETRLSSGKLQDLGISDGSKLTLVPTVEAGLMSQASRPEQSVMQALESLTETQVSDFLSGRSPLTLALRVGDHMMFVQLQLAAQQSGGQHLQHRQLIARGGAEGTMGPSTGASGGFSRAPTPHHHHSHPHSRPHPNLSQPHPVPSPSTSTVAFPPASSHQRSPPMYPSSSSAPSSHCSTPPPSSSLPPALPGPTQPQPRLRPRAPPTAAPCPEANCAKSASNGTSASAHSSSSRKPGAIIESFVNHAPGVFSGTFSGTLHPNCQDSTGRPRRDIGTILQILNDLLSATRHYQGVPPSLTQLRYQTQCGSPSPASTPPSPPPSPPATTAGIAGISAKATSVPARSPISPPLHPLVQCQSQIRMCKPPGDRVRQTENRATRCKVERLQLLMQQKRLRRKARRDSRAPYHWLPNRKAGRSNSNSSVSSEGSMDLDFDDSVWKPDVKADMKSEFVMA
ncbi:LOW QUALITY PROTEIN: midnolin [Coregonus clupeaformis]|uniref:LOW QUALITY PROTEIN: midnolin n=1 Tax=Coregonus clupeaformis TaxID=59861 RepID=UPI001E1C7B6E|nr:LOW QUALITY PROTEIN: midnolin [Coregonus clupeaformis]